MTTQNLNLSMIILMHNDLARGVAFYKDLGLTLKFLISNKWAEFEISGIKLGLAATTQELPDRRTGIVFEVPNVLEYYEQHKDIIQFLDKPVEAIHGFIVSFRDPGNNIMDLYQPTPEKVKAAVQKAEQDLEKQDKCCSHDHSNHEDHD